MKEILLADLLLETDSVIQTFHYATSTLVFYRRHWKNLKSYYELNATENYSVQLSSQFLEEHRLKMQAGKESASNYRSVKRAISFLQDYHENGVKTWRRIPPLPEAIHDSEDLQIVAEYKQYLSDLQKSNGTIRAYVHIAKDFFVYINSRVGQIHIQDLGPEDIHSYITNCSIRYPKGMHVFLPALRSFFQYLAWRHLSDEKLIMSIPQSSRRVVPLRSSISKEEMVAIVQSTKNFGASPKRDYAILLLASESGLRRSDIVKLELKDIHWKDHTINIIQKKTLVPLIIPILPETGNALADYILHERPESDSNNVFIRNLAPYQKINGSVCYEIIRKAMDRNGINQKAGEHKGMHCLRHSLAQQLMDCNVPLPVISSVLGHQNKNSTKAYLAVDYKKLSSCALSLKGIEVTKEEFL